MNLSLSALRRMLSGAGLVLAAAAFVAGPAAAQTEPAPSEKFGDWALGCRAAKDQAERCVLTQNIVFKQSSKRVLNIQITQPAPDRAYIAAVTAPLGILLQAGLVLMIDDKELVRFPLQICNVNGCMGQFPVSDDVRGAMADGKSGKVIIRQPDGRAVGIEFSLNGYKAGMDALVAKK
jgi:invasion protein IalB